MLGCDGVGAVPAARAETTADFGAFQQVIRHVYDCVIMYLLLNSGFLSYNPKWILQCGLWIELQ